MAEAEAPSSGSTWQRVEPIANLFLLVIPSFQVRRIEVRNRGASRQCMKEGP
jgi:hypothetical protein